MGEGSTMPVQQYNDPSERIAQLKFQTAAIWTVSVPRLLTWDRGTLATVRRLDWIGDTVQGQVARGNIGAAAVAASVLWTADRVRAPGALVVFLACVSALIVASLYERVVLCAVALGSLAVSCGMPYIVWHLVERRGVFEPRLGAVAGACVGVTFAYFSYGDLVRELIERHRAPR